MGSVRFIYLLFKWILSGRSGIHSTKNLKSIIRPLSEYLKYSYSYPYLSIYMLKDGQMDERIGWAGRVWRFFAHP